MAVNHTQAAELNEAYAILAPLSRHVQMSERLTTAAAAAAV